MCRNVASILGIVLIAIAPALRAQMSEPVRPTKLAGIVLDVDGRAVADSPVALIDRTSVTIDATRTDGQGCFHFDKVDRARLQRGELLVLHAARTAEIPARVRTEGALMVIVAPTAVEGIRVTSLAQVTGNGAPNDDDDDKAGGLLTDSSSAAAGGGGAGGGGAGGGGGLGGLTGLQVGLGGLGALGGVVATYFGVDAIVDNNNGDSGQDANGGTGNAGTATDLPASPVVP